MVSTKYRRIILKFWQMDQQENEDIMRYANKLLARYRDMVCHEEYIACGFWDCPKNSSELLRKFINGIYSNAIKSRLDELSYIDTPRAARQGFNFNAALKYAIKLEKEHANGIYDEDHELYNGLNIIINL